MLTISLNKIFYLQANQHLCTVFVHLRERPRTLNQLRIIITQDCKGILSESLVNVCMYVRGEFYDQLGYYEIKDGGIFKTSSSFSS